MVFGVAMWAGCDLAVHWKEVRERFENQRASEHDGKCGVALRADSVWDVVECWVRRGESLFEKVETDARCCNEAVSC